MSDDCIIIRAGFRSTAFVAGVAEVNIAGIFSQDDVEDLMALLDMTQRAIRRQATRNIPTAFLSETKGEEKKA